MKWFKWVTCVISGLLILCLFFIASFIKGINFYTYVQAIFLVVAILTILVLKHYKNYIYYGLGTSIATSLVMYYVMSINYKLNFFTKGFFMNIDFPLVFIAEFLILYNGAFVFYQLWFTKPTESLKD